jgi:hypothetical protein
MARVRKPRSDEELAKEERELLLEQLQQDHIDLQAEEQEKLAEAGEPEARNAVSALRAVTRGNNLRLSEAQQEAVAVTDAASEATGTAVEDERVTEVRTQLLQKRIKQERFERHEAVKELTDKERARALMRNHWQRWAKDGSDNYSKACSVFRLGVGKDAVALVDGGVFDSHLDVAQFIQRMAPVTKDGEQSDWTDDLERELRELRGEE